MNAAQFQILLDYRGTAVIWAGVGTPAAQMIADWATLSQVVTLDQQKTGGQTTRAINAIVQPGGDLGAVNAYYVGKPQIQIKAMDLPRPPQKFDVITTQTGQRYVLDVIDPIFEKNDVVAYVCYAAGK